jgi:hypothetical protein
MFSPFLAEQVRLAHAGPAWHGASLAENLAGINAEQAASRPIPEAHSVWEIVLHLSAWVNEVTRRMEGGSPDLPAEGDWPAVGRVSDEAWARATAALAEAHERLADAVARGSEEPAARHRRDPWGDDRRPVAARCLPRWADRTAA